MGDASCTCCLGGGGRVTLRARPLPFFYAILPLLMYLIEVIPLSRKLPQETLSYLSRKPFARGDIVCAPLQTQTIDVLVVQSSDIRERKQEIKSLSSRLRFICEDTKKENPFSRHYLNAVFSYTDLTGIPAGDIVRVSSPKKIWRERGRAKTVSSQSSPSLLQAPYQKRVEALIELIREKLGKHISTHIIIPEREQRISFSSLLKKKFGENRVFLIDGRVSDLKREKYLEIVRQETSVLVTSIPFLDVPLFNKGVLVIEQFHSDMYLATRPPFLNLRELVIQYAREASIELILSDVLFDWRLMRSFSNGERQLPFVRNESVITHESLTFIPYYEERLKKLTDEERIEEILRKMRKDSFLFSQRFEKQLTQSVESGERIFLFAQKKYFSSQLVCLDCGNVIGDASHRLVREGEKIRFIHRETGEREDAPDFCPICSSWRLKPLGVGSERIKEALEERFPDRGIFLLDAEHGSPRVWRKQVDSLREKKSYILIGTKQAFPYLPYLTIDTSFIPSLDIHFFLRSPEQEERYLYDVATLMQYSQRTVLQTRLFRKESMKRRVEMREKISGVFQKTISEKLEKLFQERFSHEKTRTELLTQSLPLWNVLSAEKTQQDYLSSLGELRRRYPLPLAILAFREEITKRTLETYQNETFSLVPLGGREVLLSVKNGENWRKELPLLITSLTQYHPLSQLSFL